MLKVIIENTHEKAVGFICPVCTAIDVMYNRTPPTCWNCDAVHKFDIAELISKEQRRSFFHFNGMTNAEMIETTASAGKPPKA